MARQRSKRILIWLILLLIIAGLTSYLWPIPSLKPIIMTLPSETAKKVVLAWPNAPEAAVGANGWGLLDQNGAQTPKPIASTAKLITALTVLQKYPLQPNQQGPIIHLSAADVAIYNQYSAEGGSVLPVTDGEQISEHEVLEAMMLPSANNLADSLAIWAFGSLAAYKTAASQYLQTFGLNQTTVGSDASGFAPDTTSTAHDLAIIGQTALANAALAAIVSEKQTTLPIIGTVSNVNWLLGQDGVIGIKTGNTDQAGGVYVFGVKDSLDMAHSVTFFGAIVGSDNLQDAINSALPLINSVKQGFVLNTITTAGQVVGRYNVPWGQPVAAVSKQAVETVSWASQPNQAFVKLNPVKAPGQAGQTVGQISTKPANTSGNVVLQKPITNPPWWWRLFRYKF